MKLLLLVLFGLFLCNPILGQVPEQITALAQYRLIHKYDTINPSLVNTEVFNLYLGKNSSDYKSYDKIIQDSIMKSEFQKTGSMAPPIGRRASNDEVFIYSKENKLFENVSNVIGKFVVERTYPVINWSILPEKKIINGYQCQKAKGDYHGRSYTVWFTNELPFKAGPWKLIGLPGLILEAEDRTGRIKFELINFKTIQKSENKTYWGNETTIILWANYIKTSKAIEDDPIGYIEKTLGGKFNVDSKVKPNHFNPMLPKKSINFPLETLEYYTQQ